MADRIVKLVQTGLWKLRHVTPAEAEGILQFRAALSNEQCADVRAVESDREFAATIKRDFSLDLEL